MVKLSKKSSRGKKQNRVKTVSKKKKMRNKKGSKLLKGIKKIRRKTRKVIKFKGGKYTEADKKKICNDLHRQLNIDNNYEKLITFLNKEGFIISKDTPIDCESDLNLTNLFSEVNEQNKIIKEVNLKEYIPNIPDEITIYASKRPQISDTIDTKDYQFILWLWYMKGVRLFITFDSEVSDSFYIKHKEEQKLSIKLNLFLENIGITTNNLKIEHIDINDYFTIPIPTTLNLPTENNFTDLFNFLQNNETHIYMHCGSGMGRTGIMLIASIYFYYIKYENVVPFLKDVVKILINNYNINSFYEVFNIFDDIDKNNLKTRIQNIYKALLKCFSDIKLNINFENNIEQSIKINKINHFQIGPNFNICRELTTKLYNLYCNDEVQYNNTKFSKLPDTELIKIRDTYTENSNLDNLYTSLGFWTNKDLVLYAVKKDGLTLNYASDELKGEKVVAETAIKQNSEAIKYINTYKLWNCNSCQTINLISKTNCIMCDELKPVLTSVPESVVEPVQEQALTAEGWTCPFCTLINKTTDLFCKICGNSKPQ